MPENLWVRILWLNKFWAKHTFFCLRRVIVIYYIMGKLRAENLAPDILDLQINKEHFGQVVSV